MSDEDMTPEEFDRRTEEGEQVEVNVNLRRPWRETHATGITYCYEWSAVRGFVPVPQTSSNWRGK